MKPYSFIIFFSIVLVVYTAAHYYVYIRGMQAFSLQGNAKKWTSISYIVLASLFMAGMFLERSLSSAFSEWILKIGSTWLAFLLYFLIAILIIDVIRVLNSIFHFLPHVSQHAKQYIGITIFAIVSITILIGHINALRIQVVTIPLQISKTVNEKQHIKILMASDLHFGAIIGEKWERKFLQLVEQQQPDMVLLCGDIVDGDIAPVLRKQLGKHIQDIQTPLGLYAVTGNHEYIGGINKALEYFKSIHIQILRDEVLELENGIQIVGRNDVHGQTTNHSRKSLDTLLLTIDRKKPIIVMDHQPYSIQESVANEVDLHLSGHTHNGQLWPFNYITNAIFDISWGHKLIEKTHVYVSSGFGTWGPTVRIGNKPEVVVFDITFTPEYN